MCGPANRGSPGGTCAGRWLHATRQAPDRRRALDTATPAGNPGQRARAASSEQRGVETPQAGAHRSRIRQEPLHSTHALAAPQPANCTAPIPPPLSGLQASRRNPIASQVTAGHFHVPPTATAHPQLVSPRLPRGRGEDEVEVESRTSTGLQAGRTSGRISCQHRTRCSRRRLSSAIRFRQHVTMASANRTQPYHTTAMPRPFLPLLPIFCCLLLAACCLSHSTPILAPDGFHA